MNPSGDDLDLALLAMEERRWSDAIPLLDRFLSRQPHHAAVLVDRAVCLEEAGRLDDACAGYEEAIRVAPSNAEAHYYYARTLARLRLATRATMHLTLALALDERLAEMARDERAFRDLASRPASVGSTRRCALVGRPSGRGSKATKVTDRSLPS